MTLQRFKTREKMPKTKQFKQSLFFAHTKQSKSIISPYETSKLQCAREAYHHKILSVKFLIMRCGLDPQYYNLIAKLHVYLCELPCRKMAEQASVYF